ncbi:MAG: TAXI family TRAP transporter solute-binding subunit [Rhodomicrobium sp.]
MRRPILSLLPALLASIFAIAASKAASTYVQKKLEANLSVVTVEAAGSGGTYLPIAEDLQNILDDPKDNTLRVIPVIGRGGGQNLSDLLFLRGIDVVIAQQEHFAYLKKQYPILYTNIEQRIHYITKLYDSEFHLLARKNIKSYNDLEGKKVNLYKPMSAGDIGGRTIFDLIGVRPIIVNYDLETSIEMLKNGEIAATAYLAGAPISGYAQLKDTQDLHFVPLDEETLGAGTYAKLLDVFLPANLDSKSYPLLVEPGKPVPTVASGAVLAAFVWPEGTAQSQKTAKFVNKFFDNFDRFLQPPHHPKWREVNLSAEIPGWTRLKAAQDWLDAHKASIAKTDEMRTAFGRFIEMYASKGNAGLTEEQQRELWNQFQVWFAAHTASGGRR